MAPDLMRVSAVLVAEGCVGQAHIRQAPMSQMLVESNGSFGPVVSMKKVGVLKEEEYYV